MATDISDLIAADHRKVEALFDQLDKDDGDRRRLADQVADELAAHTAGEEQILYPAIRDMVQGGSSLADAAQSDHAAMKGFVAALAQEEPGSRSFETALRNLVTAVNEHAAEEENEMLPALRIMIGADKMAELGDLFERVKGTVVTGSHR
jgi:hemerythrin superfamily protein